MSRNYRAAPTSNHISLSIAPERLLLPYIHLIVNRSGRRSKTSGRTKLIVSNPLGWTRSSETRESRYNLDPKTLPWKWWAQAYSYDSNAPNLQLQPPNYRPQQNQKPRTWLHWDHKQQHTIQLSSNSTIISDSQPPDLQMELTTRAEPPTGAQTQNLTHRTWIQEQVFTQN